MQIILTVLLIKNRNSLLNEWVQFTQETIKQTLQDLLLATCMVNYMPHLSLSDEELYFIVTKMIIFTRPAKVCEVTENFTWHLLSKLLANSLSECSITFGKYRSVLCSIRHCQYFTWAVCRLFGQSRFTVYTAPVLSNCVCQPCGPDKDDNSNGKESLTLICNFCTYPSWRNNYLPLGSCSTSEASLTGLDVAWSALQSQ